MTDQKHTKELLKTVDHSWSDVGIYDEKDRRIATLSIYDEATEDNQDELEVEQSANAKRLVECWNACAGIASPLDLRRQRDELREALEKIALIREEDSEKYVVKADQIACEALTKTKGAV